MNADHFPPAAEPPVPARRAATIVSARAAWAIGVLSTLAIALVLDVAIGTLPARSFIAANGRIVDRALVYTSRLGMLPVVVACGIGAVAWLVRRRRLHAGAAVASAVVAALVFSARSFAAADVIGWRAALTHMLTDGRTAATTAVAIVTAFVLFRERMIGARAALALGFGPPAVIGLARFYVRAHGVGAIGAQWLIGMVIAGGIVGAYTVALAHTEMRERD